MACLTDTALRSMSVNIKLKHSLNFKSCRSTGYQSSKLFTPKYASTSDKSRIRGEIDACEEKKVGSTGVAGRNEMDSSIRPSPKLATSNVGGWWPWNGRCTARWRQSGATTDADMAGIRLYPFGSLHHYIKHDRLDYKKLFPMPYVSLIYFWSNIGYEN